MKTPFDEHRSKNYQFGKILWRWPYHFGVTQEDGARPHFSITLYPEFLNVVAVFPGGRRFVLEVFAR